MVRLPYVTALTTLFSYGLLFAFGQLRDFFRRILDARKPSNLKVRCPRPRSCLPQAPRRWTAARGATLRIRPVRCSVSRRPCLTANFVAGLRADMLGPRGFLHAPSLSPHPGEAIATVSRTIIVDSSPYRWQQCSGAREHLTVAQLFLTVVCCC